MFELKLDGWRVLAERRGTEARLLSRNGNDLSASFPEVVRSLRALPMTNAVIDGEVVTLDEKGHPNFQRLQQRARLRRPLDIRRAAVESPATLYAFDLPSLEGYDLRTLPLVERKALLARVVPPAGPLRYLDHIEKQGEAFFAQVERMGLEGIIAKKGDSPYKGGTLAGVAQDQGGAERRFRGGGIHGAQGKPRRVRGAAPGAVRREAAGVRRTRRQRFRRPAAG